jgi:hypothetical protein
MLKEVNIIFYYFDLGRYKKDIKMINYLFNQTITLAKFYNKYGENNNEIIVLWLPIDSNRDFNFDKIDRDTLDKCTENFNAFTASGVTFGDSPRYTIISRYEEVSKLLLHELIHNLNMDGNHYHDHNYKLIDEYKDTKGNNYDYEYSIYESYTEILSSYLNLIFRNIDLDDKEQIINNLIVQIIIELLYSYNVVGNLMRLNDYKSFESFKKIEEFKGEICVYEYYYLKGLMYNNFKIIIINSNNGLCQNFKNIYEKIINIDKDDKLLQDVCNNHIKNTNLSYIFYDRL